MFYFFRKQRKSKKPQKINQARSVHIHTVHIPPKSSLLCNTIIHEDFMNKTLLELHDITIALKLKQYQVGLSLEEREQLVKVRQTSELKRKVDNIKII